MYVISVYSENGSFLSALNFSLSREMGECSIHTINGDTLVYVSNRASHECGIFIPCHNRQEAVDLALQGIPVLDIDRIIDSMEDYDRSRFSEDIEMGRAEDDNFVATQIQVRLQASLWNEAMIDRLPVLYGSFRMPILNPAEFELLKNRQPFSLNLTVQSQKAIINYVVDQKR